MTCVLSMRLILFFMYPIPSPIGDRDMGVNNEE
jgi:hypothetical protein